MINAIAIDDERNALGIIEEYVKCTPDITLLECFTDPLKALPMLDSHAEIDLVFLDIQMQKFNGLALAKRLPKKCKIILTTAYHEYAFEGFEMDVVDYLLKPYSLERFHRAIEKARALLQYQLPEGEKPEPPLNLKPAEADVIFVKTDFKNLRIKIDDIVLIEGTGNYVTIYTTETKMLTLQKMKVFEEHLKSYQFARIHKSYIISLQHITAVHKSSVVVGGRELPIGDSYKDLFLQRFQASYKQL